MNSLVVLLCFELSLLQLLNLSKFYQVLGVFKYS